MKRLKCTVAYVGAAYDGWQSQKLGLSVQEQLETAVARINDRKTKITGSGRTDAGVNAREQVFMFDTDRDAMSCRKWMGAVNAFLPEDIHITKIEEVSPLFHARYNVRWKKYTYRVHTGTYDVFSAKTAYQCPIELDFEVMKKTASILEGRHDFTSFNSSPLSLYPDQVRNVFRIELEKTGDDISISFYGKGFLQYMVRMMSSAIIETGKHKITPEHVRDMLEAKKKDVPRKNAPACGLTLEHVEYFEMVAYDQETQIREYLRDDPLPASWWSLEDLEARVRENRYPRAYMYCTKTTQQPLGFFCLYEEGSKGELVLFDADQYKEKAEHILPELARNDLYHAGISICAFDEKSLRF